MHPIIKEFIETSEKLSLIVDKYFDKNNYLEVVFQKLVNEKRIFDVDIQIYLEIDKAIFIGHSDAELYLLFISYAIGFTAPRMHLERSNAIYSIGTSLSIESIHQVVRAFFIQEVSILKGLECKHGESNRLMNEALKLIDKTLPRYNSFLLHMALFLSEHGRLNELDKKDSELLDLLNNRGVKYIRLQNCISTCNYKEGFLYLEEYKKLSQSYEPTKINDMNDLLKILSGNFEEINYQDNIIRSYVNVLHSLNLGDLDRAKINFQILKNSQRNRWIEFPFEPYLPLHIELSLKNKGKSRLIYQEIIEKGNQHYIDDLFLARLQLIELKKEEAEETFSRLIENVKKYGAMNRLLFELKFAKEIKSSDILFLMSRIKTKKIVTVPFAKNTIKVKPNQKEKGLNLLIGESPNIEKVKSLVKKFAKLKEPVLITGETGTGKELVSRAIHDEGAYPQEPFLAINCGALTESLLQSELFGYVAGAFTGAQKERKGIFEAAGKGTVFLDEFGDISQKMQVSLLRVLESNEIRLIGGTKSRQIECKIVIATNIDLHQAVEEKKFREDLYFRLTRFDIKLPALRDRVKDIPVLIKYFLKDKNNLNEKQKKLSNDLLDTLMAYHWPGNIRELKNEMERLNILLPDKEIINTEDFDFDHLQGEPPKVKESPIKPPIEISQIPIETKAIPEIKLNHSQILEIMQRGTKSENRRKILKGLFQEYKKLTRIQLVEITSNSPGTISKDLQNLCQAGFILKITPTKSVKSAYFVLKE